MRQEIDSSLSERVKMLFLVLLVVGSIFPSTQNNYHVQRCCIDWVEPCKCPRLYITADLRPCGSELQISELNSALPRFQVPPEIRLYSNFYTVVVLLTNRHSESIEGLRFRLVFARVNIPRDRLMGVVADTVEDNIVDDDCAFWVESLAATTDAVSRGYVKVALLQGDPAEWTLIMHQRGREGDYWPWPEDELSTFRFTAESVSVESMTRLTAFLITQSSYLDIYKVNLTGLPADRIILRRQLKYMFPGESIAAASYRISAIQVLEAGTEVTSDSRLSVSQENWIPAVTTEGIEIVDADAGGATIENHFHEWLMKQRNMTV
ncbi:hypothetical protein TSMEX_006901 [Taenia solium]|eukprot:TsM_000165100 transcript=TsM_000165100 gene=TsM_000165100